MRLYPPVVLNARVANKVSTLPTGGGIHGISPILIQKGEIVVFSTWARHRLGEDLGPAPHEFRPERWANIPGDVPGFIPFNKGPRICPGRKSLILLYSLSCLWYFRELCHDCTHVHYRADVPKILGSVGL